MSTWIIQIDLYLLLGVAVSEMTSTMTPTSTTLTTPTSITATTTSMVTPTTQPPFTATTTTAATTGTTTTAAMNPGSQKIEECYCEFCIILLYLKTLLYT